MLSCAVEHVHEGLIEQCKLLLHEVIQEQPAAAQAAAVQLHSVPSVVKTDRSCQQNVGNLPQSSYISLEVLPHRLKLMHTVLCRQGI